MDPAEQAALGIAGSNQMQEFERGFALILARLYQHFPVPHGIQIRNLEPNVNGELERIYAATMEFLSMEGYLRYSSGHGPRARGLTWNNQFHDVVLTEKGLAVLDAVPPVLKPQSGRQEEHAETVTPEPVQLSRGRRLIDALKTGATDAIRTVVREVISEGVKSTLGR